MRVVLPHGVVAELTGDFPPAAGPAEVFTLRRPPPDVEEPIPRGRLRWNRNRHLWETCECGDCVGRRMGVIGAGYEVRPR